MNKFHRVRANGRTAILSFAILANTALTPVSAVADDSDINALLNMSLAELVDIEVTSVSKRAEKASEAAAAIFVITQDDIKRSGVTSIPEVLRMAPGIQVARSGSHQWAISARGLNDQFSNKLLVLMDGRSLYSPLFGGVWWDAQDTMLEDIDRIEVIRGPGATLWGANAVNGVINIITKDSGRTQGNVASLTIGNNEQIGAYRHGGSFDDGSYRLYAKYSKNRESKFIGGSDARDDWDVFRAGFRSDWGNGRDEFTLQGDVYEGEEGTLLSLPSLTSTTFSDVVHDNQTIAGANILGRWSREISADSEIRLQAYVDRARRDDLFLEQTVNTFDLDFQHIWEVADRHQLVWGMGYRYIHDDLEGTYTVFSPDGRGYDVWSAFLQDKITLLPEELFVTLGSKLEHNDYSGVEVQPSARITWLIDDKQTLWGAVSRSVRTPVRVSDDVFFSNKAIPTTGGTGIVTLIGGRNLDAETSISYEAGYRVQPAENLSFDAAVFFNDYNNLFAETSAAPFVGSSPVYGAHLVIPFTLTNSGSGTSYGAEISANWNVSSNWSLSGSYSLLKLDLESSSAFFATEAESPNHQFNIASHYSFSEMLGWDVGLYYMDAIEPGTNSIPDYYRLDTSLSWEPVDGLELSVVGQNLLDNRHSEFEPFIYESSIKEIGRSVYGKALLRF